MTPSPWHAAGRPGTAGNAFPLVLELSLAEGDQVSGTVGVAGAQHAMPFHGWIDLMSAINSLRASAIPLHSPQADNQQPPATLKNPAAEPASNAHGNDNEETP